MRRVIKSKGKIVHAWRLGDNSEMEKMLLEEGKIRKTANGRYELFSQEAVNGKGELSEAGDYFKVDSSGMPYPNTAVFFENHHREIGPDTFLQMPEPLDAWEAEDPICEEMEFLLKTQKLEIHPEIPEKYFQAFLFGAPLAAARDSVVVFYSVQRDSDGKIQNITFNFVARDEFEKTYQYIKE